MNCIPKNILGYKVTVLLCVSCNSKHVLNSNLNFKKCESENRSVVYDSLWTHRLHSPWILQARILERVAVPISRGSSQPGIKPRSPTSEADILLSEPPGKPKNTGVGSLSLLQQIFPIQESNWDLLHCRQILYQLSHKGRHPSPTHTQKLR